MGIMRFLEESKYNNLRVKTIQNPYSLLNRLFENASAEVCLRENVGLLRIHQWLWYFIWKILTGESHPKARLTLFPVLSIQQRAKYSATRLYHEIAIKTD
jgi:aryl-alcohol dehydrogenase-like predicted oxidoreductase